MKKQGGVVEVTSMVADGFASIAANELGRRGWWVEVNSFLVSSSLSFSSFLLSSRASSIPPRFFFPSNASK